ncbi:hypothetical protein [Actinacidiphila glaucinigra]
MIYAVDAVAVLAIYLAARAGSRLPHHGAHARRRFTSKGNAR